MIKKSLFYRLTLGLLVSALIMSARPAHAQFGGVVFDPKNYAVNIEKKIEDARRHVQTFDNAVKQYTTLRGVLGNVEDLVAKENNAITTMSNIGQTVRASLQLKDQVEAIITTRLTMLKSIDDRLRRGIFDPEADMRDLEDYLRTSIGRSSQDSLANLDRLRKMDNTLERLTNELQKAQAELATTRGKRAAHVANLADLLRQPPAQKCADCIADVIGKIQNCDMLIAQYARQIEELRGKIEERVKKYHALTDERIKFAEQVDATNKAWSDFNDTLDGIQRALSRY